MEFKSILAGILCAAFCQSAAGQEISSEYTTFDRDADCALVARAIEEGDWADLVCPGHRGYPVFIRYTDGREIAAYGYAGQSVGMPNIMPFNEASGTVEWRILTEEGTSYPFAAIQRWFLSHPEGINGTAIREILVVSKVGQPMESEACAVAFLPATGNPTANQDSRDIADTRVRDFVCGSDPVHVDEALQNMVARQQ